MQLLSPADAAGRVTAALKNAAQATGAGFDYLLQTAKRESSLDPNAKAPSSSARGLFQFIDQTWLQVLKEDGPKLGLADQAADVTRSSSGRYTVSDPTRRAEILALRDDPDAAALLAGAFTRRNAATLQSELGRTPTDGELYAAHFLGAQGAVDLVKLAVEQPESSAAQAFPAQAAANRAIFYDKGRARTAAEVYAKVTAKPASGATVVAAAAPVALAIQKTSDDASYGPFNGGVENDKQAFHSLFKTGRRSPVSTYVAQTWSSFGSARIASDTKAIAGKAASATVASAQSVASAVPVVRSVRTETINGAAPAANPNAAVAKPAVRQSDASAAFSAAISQPVSLSTVRRTDFATPTPAPSGSLLWIARR